MSSRRHPRKAWAGRIAGATHPLVEAFTTSYPVDCRLYAYDIAGSIAHCRMLARRRIIAARDAQRIIAGLRAIKRELDREALHLRDSLTPRYAECVYYGYWFAPERAMLQAAIDDSQRGATGTARLKLYKGNVIVAGRKSSRSLYNPEVATFEDDAVYRQADAEGFIRLNALRLRIRALVEKHAK